MIVTPEHFVRDARYLGDVAGIYPGLLGEFVRLFPPGVDHAVFCGGEGWGRRPLAELVLLYAIHHAIEHRVNSDDNRVFVVPPCYQHRLAVLTDSRPWFADRVIAATPKLLHFSGRVSVHVRDNSASLHGTVLIGGILDHPEPSRARKVLGRVRHHGNFTSLPYLSLVLTGPPPICDHRARVVQHPAWGTGNKALYGQPPFYVLYGGGSRPALTNSGSEARRWREVNPHGIVSEVPGALHNAFSADLPTALAKYMGVTIL